MKGTEVVICTWCGTDHEPGDSAGFCSKVCRQDFDTACRLWAAQEYEAERLSIFTLRDCLGRHGRERRPSAEAAQ